MTADHPPVSGEPSTEVPQFTAIYADLDSIVHAAERAINLLHDTEASTGAALDGAAEHEHEWQAMGTAEVDRVTCSPVSRWRDQLWTEVLAVQSCTCGGVRRTHIGVKNSRRRIDQ